MPRTTFRRVPAKEAFVTIVAIFQAFQEMATLSNPGTPKVPANPFYRCAGPNCGTLKGSSDRWWLMWTSFADLSIPVLYLCPWDEEIAQKEGTLHVCGELCAQKLQSQFMGNVRENLMRRGG